MKKILFTCALILAASLAMGQNIPGTLALKQLDGTEVLMKDVLKDDVVIVSFWATWCKPCQAELDALQANLSKDYTLPTEETPAESWPSRPTTRVPPPRSARW